MKSLFHPYIEVKTGDGKILLREKMRIRKVLSAAVALGLMSSMSWVQAAPTVPDPLQSQNAGQPTAGSLRVDQEQKGRPDVIPSEAEIKVKEAERPALKLPNELKVQVNGFKLSGQLIYPEAELMPMLESSKGKLMNFGDLQQLADKLTNYYKSKGYIAAKVYLPVQKITNGIVEYSVVVGKFDNIQIENHTTIHDSALWREIGSLKKGDYIHKDEIERAVWLLSDLAGADAKLTIAQGDEAGTSNMVIELRPHTGKNGAFYIDNYGTRSTGYNEFGISYDFLNLAHEGDHLALDAVTTGSSLYNGSINYTIPVLKDGLTFNMGYSLLHYDLGSEYSYLDAYGTSRVFHFGFDYAIQRSRTHNLYAGVRFENGQLKDEYRKLGITYNDKKSNAGVFSLYGNEQDSKGATSWRADYKLGNLCFNSAETYKYYGKANTEGGFSKLNLSIVRRQDINRRLYVLLSARGQYSSKNLDSSERMSLGGMNGVRAYPTSEASGDIGYFTRAELHWLLPLKKQDQSLQFLAYLEHGGVQINKSSFSTDQNYRKLQGCGIGLLWSRQNDWWLRTDYAWRLGAEPAVSDPGRRSNGHFWIQGGIYF